MLKKARQYSAAEKTKIVIDAIKSEMTIAQISSKYGVHSTQSSREPLYRDSLSHHRTSDVAYGGFAVMFTKS
jgi:transposase-like protein